MKNHEGNWVFEKSERTFTKAGKEITYIIQKREEDGKERRVYRSRSGRSVIRYKR